ncbi:hypothetical protein FRC09_002157 [Ceratobasidium sp. 395]|nr:hypothetical protein FRC09_002157 [Ceratobasidium sp. 395]
MAKMPLENRRAWSMNDSVMCCVSIPSKADSPLVEPTDTLEDTAPEIRSPQAPQATANLLPGGRNPKTQGPGKATAAQGEPKRKLIVCIDGTSNQFSEKVILGCRRA